MQEKFAESGRKLDLDPNDRTKDSWGFVVNKGSKFSIFTYHSVTKEDFAFIQRIIFEIEEKNE